MRGTTPQPPTEHECASNTAPITRCVTEAASMPAAFAEGERGVGVRLWGVCGRMGRGEVSMTSAAVDIVVAAGVVHGGSLLSFSARVTAATCGLAGGAVYPHDPPASSLVASPSL